MATYQKRPNLLFPELTANWQHLVFTNTHIRPDALVTVWQTWDESFGVAERIDVCLRAYETLLTLTSPCVWGHDTDLGILAINLPLILSPMVWVACVSGPMKVTPSAAYRDNKGFPFTAQAYQVEAEHVHSRVNKHVWETDSVGGQKSSYICSFLPIFFRAAHRQAGDICWKQCGGYRGRSLGPSSLENSSGKTTVAKGMVNYSLTPRRDPEISRKTERNKMQVWWTCDLHNADEAVGNIISVCWFLFGWFCTRTFPLHFGSHTGWEKVIL